MKTERGWIYIDDLCVSVKCFSFLQEVLYSYPDGWFFAVFQKSECLDINLHETANRTSSGFSINPTVRESVSKEGCSMNELEVERKGTSYRKGGIVGFNNYMKSYRKRPEVKAKQNAYIRKYRLKSNTELDSNKSNNLEVCKENEPQRNDSVNYVIKRKSGSISSTDTHHADEKVKRAKCEKMKQYSQKAEVKEKHKLYMREYRLQRKIANSSTVTEATACDVNL